MDSIPNFWVMSLLVTHMLFAIILLRLYQLLKKSRLCRDTWIMKVGVVLAVAGTITLGALPILEQVAATSSASSAAATVAAVAVADDIQVSNEILFWSFVRTIGLLLVCAVLWRALTHPHSRPSWHDKQHRKSRLPAEDSRLPH